MKELYIHVGTRKTGTTTVQSFLAMNSSVLAENYDLWYPNPATANYGCKAHNNHLILPFSIAQRWPSFVANRERIAPNHAFAALQQDIIKTGHKTILISSEDFSIAALHSPTVVNKLASLTNCRVKIIVYLRPQPSLIHSIYSWSDPLTMTGMTLDQLVNSGYDSKNMPWLDYQKLLSPWEAAFGKESITVRTFTKGSLVDGDVKSDLLSLFGISVGSEFKSVKKVLNPAKSGAVIEFLRNIGPILDNNEKQEKLYAELLPYIKAATDNRQYPQLSKQNEELIQSRYAASNSYVAREYFGRDCLFPDYTPVYHNGEAVFPIEQLCMAFVNYWRDSR